MRNLLITTASAAVLSLALCAPAQATYIATLSQVGSNVVGTASGSLDLTDLSLYISGAGAAAVIYPQSAEFHFGATFFQSIDLYRGISGAGSFGPGFITFADSGSGAAVGVVPNASWLVVPHGYVSGTALGASTATWNNQSYASLGITPGTYTWTWGSGADADSVVLNILSPAVPEPLTLSLFGAGLAAAGVLRRRRQPR